MVHSHHTCGGFRGNIQQTSVRNWLFAALVWLGVVLPAWAQVTPTACTATLVAVTGGYRISVPYLVYAQLSFSADFDYQPTTDGAIWFRLASLIPLTNTAAFTGCQANLLSSDYQLNLPHLNFAGSPFSESMQLVPGANAQNPNDFWFNVTSFKPLTLINNNRTFATGWTVSAGEAWVVNTGASSATLTVTGDFLCRGDLEIWDAPTNLRINVSGNADLSCNIRFAKESSTNSLTVVVNGAVNLGEGFSLPTTGHVIVTDDPSLIKSTDTYVADVNSDDGVTPSIIPATDGGTVRSVPVVQVPPMAQAAPCTTTHTLRGPLAPPVNRRRLSQGFFDGTPVVLATWFHCNVEINAAKVDPPKWDAPPLSDSSDKPSANGRKGLTLNLYSGGKVTFKGNTVVTLMDGGRGQDHSVTGNPAVAKAGNGGASGDLKIAAAGGFDFSNGSLTIVPGRGGDGGNATATGTPGADGCPGQSGGSASATAGDGADSKKILKARGFDPSGKVTVTSVLGGHGGNATATGGVGGNGTAGKCNGGAGGSATAQGGKGGDSAFKYSGAGNVTANQILAGNAGTAVSLSGHGGNGGDQAKRCDVGGNGGAGGTSTAKSGVVGVATGGTNGADGIASAGGGNGDGGLCGNFNSANGSGGSWSEFVAGTLRKNGQFKDGNRDCACAIVSEPRISVTPGVTEFTHNYGVSSCPQLIGSVTIANTGTGSFSWRMGTLPPWLSASNSSGVAGESIQLFFTCTGYTPSMSSVLTITGTNTDTGQVLVPTGSLTVTGVVKQ